MKILTLEEFNQSGTWRTFHDVMPKFPNDWFDIAACDYPIRFWPAKYKDIFRYARAICEEFARRGQVLIGVGDSDMWDYPVAPLFEAYHKSLGDTRRHGDAFLHLFEPDEAEAMAVLVALCMLINWSARIVSADKDLRLEMSFDEDPGAPPQRRTSIGMVWSMASNFLGQFPLMMPRLSVGVKKGLAAILLVVWALVGLDRLSDIDHENIHKRIIYKSGQQEFEGLIRKGYEPDDAMKRIRKNHGHGSEVRATFFICDGKFFTEFSDGSEVVNPLSPDVVRILKKPD